MGAAADRDMHAWWDEYEDMMADYKSKRNDSICTEEEMLAELIEDIEGKVEKVTRNFCKLKWGKNILSLWLQAGSLVLHRKKSSNSLYFFEVSTGAAAVLTFWDHE